MSLDLSKLLQNSKAAPFNSLTNWVDLSSTAGELFLVAPQDITSEVYIFDTRGEEEVNLESEITDNYVEDNTTVQDHIGLRPRTITLSGYVGELSTKNRAGEKITSFLEPKLAGASFFAPVLTAQAEYIMNRAQEVYGIYEKANETVDRLEDMLMQVPVPDVSNQQKAFGRFQELWATRRLATVYTPFGAFNNMAIQSLTARQEEDTTYISSFSVTFKQIRKVETIFAYKNTAKQKAGRAAASMAEEKDKGIQKPSSKSGAKQLYEMIRS